MVPIIKTKEWNEYVNANKDPYGKAVIDAARELMNKLDEIENNSTVPLMDLHGWSKDLVHQVNDELNLGLTAFQAGCVAQIVSECHSLGELFRKDWNRSIQLSDEGEEANKTGGVLNPALLILKA